MKSTKAIAIHIILCAAISSAASARALASDAQVSGTRPIDNPRSRYVLSARGPGEGEASFGAAASFLFIVPSGLDARFVWGISDRWDLELTLDGPSFFTRTSAGGKFRLFETEDTAMAIRASAEVMTLTIPGEDSAALFNVKPGILFSTGGKGFEVTLEANAPFAAAGTNVRVDDVLDRFHYFEASLGLELAAVTSANALIQITGWFTREHGELLVVPLISVGGAI